MLNQSFHPCNKPGSKPSVHACSQTFVLESTQAYLQSSAVNFNHICTSYMLLHGSLLSISMERNTLENPTWPTCFIVFIRTFFYPLAQPFDLSLSVFLCLQVFQPQLQQYPWGSPEREVTAQPASESIRPSCTSHQSCLHLDIITSSVCSCGLCLVRLEAQHHSFPCCLLFKAQSPFAV